MWSACSQQQEKGGLTSPHEEISEIYCPQSEELEGKHRNGPVTCPIFNFGKNFQFWHICSFLHLFVYLSVCYLPKYFGKYVPLSVCL